MKSNLVFLVLFFVNFTINAQNEACQIVGEISSDVLTNTSLLACIQSKNPAVCRIAQVMQNCNQTASCQGVVSVFVEKGCNFTVIKTKKGFEIVTKAKSSSYEYLKETYSELERQITNLLWRRTL